MSWIVEADRNARAQAREVLRQEGWPKEGVMHAVCANTADSALVKGLYALTDHHGLVDDLFYDDGVRGPQDFVELMAEADRLVLAFAGAKLAGYCWTNMRLGAAVAAHCCVFPWAWGPVAWDCGKTVMRELLTETTRAGDDYRLGAVYGVTPVTHRHAVLFARKIGMRRMGLLPFGCNVHGKATDAVLSVITRDDLGGQA